jgi:hypothetical protein
MEVSIEMLLEAPKSHSVEESSNKLQIVPYGFFLELVAVVGWFVHPWPVITITLWALAFVGTLM